MYNRRYPTRPVVGLKLMESCRYNEKHKGYNLGDAILSYMRRQ